MKRVATWLVLGPVVGASLLTMLLGYQMQGGQCASVQLPLGLNFSIGETCRSSR
jgi:hypothetical protein